MNSGFNTPPLVASVKARIAPLIEMNSGVSIRNPLHSPDFINAPPACGRHFYWYRIAGFTGDRSFLAHNQRSWLHRKIKKRLHAIGGVAYSLPFGLITRLGKIQKPIFNVSCSFLRISILLDSHRAPPWHHESMFALKQDA